MEARAEDLEPLERARPFPSRAAIAVVVAVAIAGAVGLLVYAAHAVLLIFAGLLVGVMLDALTGHVSRLTRLSHGWSLTTVVLLLFGAIGAAGWFAVPRVIEQGRQLAEKLPDALSSTSGGLLSLPVLGGGQAGQQEPPPAEQGQQQQQQQQQQHQQQQESPGRGEGEGQDAPAQGTGGAASEGGLAQQVGPSVLKPVARTVGATLAAIANVIVIVIIGIYAAARPDLYVEGSLRLLPPRWRDRGAEALHECAHQLRRWMLGTLIAMSSAALMTGLGLWLLGVPYVLPLALLAGLLEVVPNFGPLLASIPAILLAAVGGEVAWWKVALMYAIVQTVQSYVIQPLTQERMVEVPPVLLIAALVLFGWILGVLGLLLAVPTLVVVMVLVRLLYLRDTLHEHVTPAPVSGY